MALTIQSEGRRHYLTGDTYPLRGQLRAMGAHWDAARKAWWTSKRAELESLITAAPVAPAAYAPAPDEAMRVVGGNTYPVREQLRALGGRWDGDTKVWMVPASQYDAAQALVAGAPKQAYRRASGHNRGRWTGCSCGSREDSSGQLIASPRNCASCNFDGFDC